MEFSIANLQPKERASFALRALYEAAGCRKYHMGRFEEYGLYQENRSFLSSEQVITFTDLDGRLLALKPDVTLSIAKTAQPAPGETLRYYYHENVYRPSAESHTFKEISQMGLEMLGAVGEAQVQQAVCLAARSLDALGADWVLEVSHMGYLFGLFDALGVPDAARAKLLEKLREKNAHELRAAAGAAGLADAAADILCSVLSLCGSYADTLAKAAALCRNDAMRAAVAELEALAVPLEKAGGVIRLDMTLAGEMEYYNGLVFQGYLKALPRPLLKGGRYDLLMQKFTPGAGAIGFAVYLDELDRLSAPLPPVQKNSTDRVMLNVALPKGRLGDKVYHLLAVEALDVGGGFAQRFEEVGVHARKGFVDLLLRHLQGIDLCAVKFQRVILQGFIAPGAHIGNNAVHHVLHVLFRADIAVQDLFGLQLVKVIQLDHFASSLFCSSARSFSSMVSISACLNW